MPLANRLLLALALGGSTAALAKDGPERNYERACAGCHGPSLEGGKGPSLLGDLKHGADAAALTRSVHAGFPLTGMPAFGEAMTAGEIQALVVFLRERRVNRVVPGQPPPLDQQLVRHSERHDYRIEAIVQEGLQVPWSFDWLPDGRILLTERIGRLRIIEDGKLLPEPVGGIPTVVERGEGGLLAVRVAPDYAQTGWIYLTFSDPGAPEHAMTKIVRGRLNHNQFTDIETIFSVPPEKYQEGFVLFGSRIEFDRGYLFFTVGERRQTGDAQKLEVPNGKVHRVWPDGRIPSDNPFADTPGAWGSIWTLGHRNPQGLAIDPVTHEIWETEHGPRGGDELNHLEAGKNYGWPAITYGINYDGSAVSDRTAAPGMEQPARHWTPSIAVSQAGFYSGDRFPNWKGSLFVGSLAMQKLLRFEVSGGRILHEEEIFSHLGRIRDIRTGPDGYLYLALEQIGMTSGRLVRLVPVNKAPGDR
jgi:glucose/arabinose dehydrogenase